MLGFLSLTISNVDFNQIRKESFCLLNVYRVNEDENEVGHSNNKYQVLQSLIKLYLGFS